MFLFGRTSGSLYVALRQVLEMKTFGMLYESVASWPPDINTQYVGIELVQSIHDERIGQQTQAVPLCSSMT